MLYLARHAEPGPDGGQLSERGERQAEHLGRRLARLLVRRITCGPLPRAVQTGQVVAAQFAQPPAPVDADEAGDYVPHLPTREELPEDWADTVLSACGDVSPEEAARGAALGRRAIELLTGPATDGRAPVEVVITHAFAIGWLVTHALGAPRWRWWPPTQGHTG